MLPFVVLNGINVSHGAVIAIVIVTAPSVFSSPVPSAVDSPASELSFTAAGVVD